MIDIKKTVEKLKSNIEKRGYYLNPDCLMTDALVEALMVNEERYGYQFCPCRLSSENYNEDKDLICPCDYRDQDINEYGTCFCGLYVSRKIALGKDSIKPIPERRGSMADDNKTWRCDVCGYICVRPDAPDVCPICGVTHDRFKEYHLK